MSDDPLLDYLEETFSSSYRHEIEQEENVWRTLPFVVATLAFQLTAPTQMREWVQQSALIFPIGMAVLLAAAAFTTFAAILLLAGSVWPGNRQYVSREPDIRAYAYAARLAALRSFDDDAVASAMALRGVKAFIASQYETAADSNRRANRTRAVWRGLAGLATLLSVLFVLVLVGLAVIIHLTMHG